MTFRLAISIHIFIPAFISAVFYNILLLPKQEKKKTIFLHCLFMFVLEVINIYFIHNYFLNYIINIIIQIILAYTLYLDKYKKRTQVILIACFIQALSYILTEIPLSFLYSIRLQTYEIFEREFTIYALILYDMWFLSLSYYYLTEFVSIKNEIRLFKYCSMIICQFIFAYIIFLLSYDLSSLAFIMIMLFVFIIVIVTNTILIKKYKSLSSDFLRRFECTVEKEMENQKQNLKLFKEEMNADIENIEMMLRYHLNDEALRFVEERYKQLKNLNVGHYCENKLVDLVLHNKVMEMQEKNIDKRFDILIQENHYVDDVDLVTLLFNLIDNAIEACEDIETDRYIYIKMFEKYSCLYLEVINSKNPKVNHSSLKTTKEDTMNHGIGVSIIRNIVKKYKGDVVFEDNTDTFKVKLFLKNR